MGMIANSASMPNPSVDSHVFFPYFADCFPVTLWITSGATAYGFGGSAPHAEIVAMLPQCYLAS